MYLYIYIYVSQQIYYFNINLQGNIQYIVRAEISAQIYHCHTQQQNIYDYIKSYNHIYNI